MGIRAAVMLVAFLLVAGCSTIGGQSNSETPTITPAPVPTETSTLSGSETETVPSISTTGVTDPRVLADHHVEAIWSMRYRWSERFLHRVQTGQTVYNVTRRQNIVYREPGRYTRESDSYEILVAGQPRRLYGFEEYGTEDVVYWSWREQPDGERVFRCNTNPPPSHEFANRSADAIRRYLNLEEATVSRARTDSSEADYFLVYGTRSRVPDFGEVEGYRARALVRNDGFVKELAVRFNATTERGTVTVTYNSTFSRIDTAAVSSPSWLPDVNC